MIMKKPGKFFVAILAVCFLCTGLVMLRPHKASAAAAPSSVGYVDYGLLVNQHPETPKATEALKAEQEKLKKEFENKAAGLSSDKEKQDLSLQLGKQLEQKRRELFSPIINSINTAIKDVATEKGLSIVVDKAVVLFGGQEITADVGKKIAGK